MGVSLFLRIILCTNAILVLNWKLLLKWEGEEHIESTDIKQQFLINFFYTSD